MTNVLNVTGRIIYHSYKSADEMKNSANSLLRINVSVTTGERKPEGAEYPPSYILTIPVWGKLAEALLDKVSNGNIVSVSGSLKAPTTYESGEGEIRVNMELDRVHDITIIPSSLGDTTEDVSQTKKKTSKKNKDKVEQGTAIDDEDDDIPF